MCLGKRAKYAIYSIKRAKSRTLHMCIQSDTPAYLVPDCQAGLQLSLTAFFTLERYTISSHKVSHIYFIRGLRN